MSQQKLSNGTLKLVLDGGLVVHQRTPPNGATQYVAKGSHVVNVRSRRDGTVEFFDRSTLTDPKLRGAVDPALGASAKNIWYIRTW